MIDYLRFDEWDHTPGEPHSIEVRVIGGKIQTNNPAWRIIDKDNYEKDWEDYQGDSSKWLKEFDDLSVDLWKDYYDEFGIEDGSQ